MITSLTGLSTAETRIAFLFKSSLTAASNSAISLRASNLVYPIESIKLRILSGE